MLKGMTTFGETYAHGFDTTVNFSQSFDSTFLGGCQDDFIS